MDIVEAVELAGSRPARDVCDVEVAQFAQPAERSPRLAQATPQTASRSQIRAVISELVVASWAPLGDHDTHKT